MPVVEERGHRRLEAKYKVAKASRRFAAPPRLNVIDELSDLIRRRGRFDSARFGGEDALAEFCGVEAVEGGGACFAVFEGGE